MSDRVGNPEERFSHDVAHMIPFRCVIPGTDFSPDAEFMFNADLSSANHYYVTSGQATLTLQKKQRIYHKCDTLICTTENHPICTNKVNKLAERS